MLALRALACAVGGAALLVPFAAPAAAHAQAAGDVRLVTAARQERIGPTHVRYAGAVEIELVAQGIRLSGDVIDYDADRHRLTAEGNVVFVTPTSRVAADRADVDTLTRTGTFVNAFGSASVSDRVDRSFFGGQAPDAFFYGETIEKIAADTYRIRKGGFTTCVQPTPRWEVTAGAVTLTVDRRAVLKHAVLKVKDVPLFYLPAMYYPINKEDRSTGFLLPIYGTSDIRGRTLSNAFFWAIDRSQDLTLMHDWFSRTGQGYGAEYRFVAAAGSRGELRAYRLDEHAVTFRQDGVEQTQPGADAIDVRGSLQQALPGGFRARASADFTTDLAARQRYQQDVLTATSPVRGYQGNVSGPLGGGQTVSATYGWREIFQRSGDSSTVGGPRVQATRALTRIGRLPVYAAATSEYATIVRFDTIDGARADDQGLTRLTASPSLQVPLTAWPFLTARSSVTWHAGWWSESRAADGRQVSEPFARHYLDLQTTLTGPVLTRVWQPSGGADGVRLKHLVEPEVVLQRSTGFDGQDRIVAIDGGDFAVGGAGSVTYGVTNRLLMRRGPRAGTAAARVRELLTLQLQQTYYTDARASTVDNRYSTAWSTRPAGRFSDIALAARSDLTDHTNASLRLEYDPQRGRLDTLQLRGTVASGQAWSTSAGWSRRRYTSTLIAAGDPEPHHALTSRTAVTFGRRHVGGAYEIDLDASTRTIDQQRVGVFYNAQCCGLAAEFQARRLAPAAQRGAIQDRRFNLSFTLAGLGTFSNVLGAFGIGQGLGGASPGH